jgi:threonine/homoserine/homoserine lactone efflux protein
MIFKGFKFGMLLQLAIGPVCIFIFQIATLQGFYIAEKAIWGVALIDGLFILLATLGTASLIEKKNIKIGLKMFGAIILLAFGFSTVLGQFGINFIPSLSLQNNYNSKDVFLRAVILTVSNPLTILFWAGIFSSKIAEQDMEKKDIYLFGFGALLSTMIFLNLIALIGSISNQFLTGSSIRILNLIVGVLLIYFGLKMIIKKA